MSDSPSSQPVRSNVSIQHTLPGGQEKWKKCELGPEAEWPQELKAYISTVTALPYPAAILWGANHVLVHNAAWNRVGGDDGQGCSLRNSLSADTIRKLEGIAKEGCPDHVQVQDILWPNERISKDVAAMASPLRAQGQKPGSGFLLQILSGATSEKVIPLEGNTNLDKVPIDEHPFFRRFAEMLPSGLTNARYRQSISTHQSQAILDRNAEAVFVNRQFYELTTRKDENKKFASWPRSILPEDYDRVMDAYRDAFRSQKQLRTEFRARGEPHPWRLLLLTPLGDENLQHVSLREHGGFICSIVDISSEKSAELAQRKVAMQAQERREQQERFIDMISHEIRNPLSAVLHCAEDISDAANYKRKDEGTIDTDLIREAVETIHICVTHQRNIVDDVLSFSKLDASLLSLSPKPSQPSRQLRNTMKMFQQEFRKQELEFEFQVDESYASCNLSWVMADIGRISQVLVNLTTNAIKFTHEAQGEKLIEISVGASLDRPRSYPPNVVFFRDEDKENVADVEELGPGEVLYVMVAVRDTGIGINEQSQKRLFERFQQATPRTEEQYGGSGLGLSISRKICQLHGGEIGVSSKEAEGSTFGFFFKVRRSQGPPDSEKERKEEQEAEDRLWGKIKGLGLDELSSAHNEQTITWSRTAPDQNSPSRRPGKDMRESDAKTCAEASTLESNDPVNLPQSASQPSTALDSTSAPTKPRQRILLVEDNAINRRIVQRKLQSRGFDVVSANDGQAAVDAVAASSFDIVLMDQQMPVLHGTAATRRIRELERAGSIAGRVPILGVTANVRSAQQHEMTASGMDDIVSKPYGIDELVAKITAVLEAQKR